MDLYLLSRVFKKFNRRIPERLFPRSVLPLHNPPTYNYEHPTCAQNILIHAGAGHAKVYSAFLQNMLGFKSTIVSKKIGESCVAIIDYNSNNKFSSIDDKNPGFFHEKQLCNTFLGDNKWNENYFSDNKVDKKNHLINEKKSHNNDIFSENYSNKTETYDDWQLIAGGLTFPSILSYTAKFSALVIVLIIIVSVLIEFVNRKTNYNIYTPLSPIINFFYKQLHNIMQV